MPTMSSNRWKLVMLTPGSFIEKKCSSRPAVYREIEKIREEVTAGVSRITGFTVYQWDKIRQSWQLFERVPVKAELK